MLTCEICGKQFPHECSANLIGEVAEECPIPKMGAYFAHAVDDADNDIPGIKFTLEGKTKTTKAGGVAAFDPLPAKPYTMTMEALGEVLSTDYDPPPPLLVTANRTVENGRIAYAVFRLNRRAPLHVYISCDGENLKTFEGATVSITKGPKLPDQPVAGKGYADFGKVSPVEYTIQAKLGDPDAELYKLSSVSKEVAVTPNVPEVVRLKAERIVQPMIHPPRNFVAVHKPFGTAARQKVFLRTNVPFVGKGVFKCASDCVQFYDAGMAIPIVDGKSEKNLDVNGGEIELAVEGLKASAIDGRNWSGRSCRAGRRWDRRRRARR